MIAPHLGPPDIRLHINNTTDDDDTWHAQYHDTCFMSLNHFDRLSELYFDDKQQRRIISDMASVAYTTNPLHNLRNIVYSREPAAHTARLRHSPYLVIPYYYTQNVGSMLCYNTIIHLKNK